MIRAISIYAEMKELNVKGKVGDVTGNVVRKLSRGSDLGEPCHQKEA